MKYLNLFIILSIFLSACVFSGKHPDALKLKSGVEDEERLVRALGDSITVDTVIGNFRLFYKVSEVKNDVTQLLTEGSKIPKEIFLNIQKLDTTSVVSYKILTMKDFETAMTNNEKEDLFIEDFYLKEVKEDSLVFTVELCRFEEDDKMNIDLFIDEQGNMNCSLMN